MDWQLTIVGVLIAVATIYVSWSFVRPWFRKKAGCGSGCGKCASSAESTPTPTGRIPLQMRE